MFMLESRIRSNRLSRRERPHILNVFQETRRGAQALDACPMQSLLRQRLQHGNQAVQFGVAGKDAASFTGEFLPVVPLTGSAVNPPECGGQPFSLWICRGRDLRQITRLLETLAIIVQVISVEVWIFAG